MSNHANLWADDVLDRKSSAEFLQKYLDSRYQAKSDEPGFVLALNADWGYGKSFMIERWQKDSLAKNHPSIHFDAWQNDFTSDPLLAFIAELEEGLSVYFKHVPVTAAARTKAGSLLKELWKPALTIVATAGAKHLIGLSLPALKDILEPISGSEEDGTADDGGAKESELKSVGEDLNKALNKALEDHRNIKTALKVFKQKLNILIDYLSRTEGIKLPIYIFVDELDRCRPSYAIELLEGIKHLFGVPGVYFVIATNLNQLSESVKAVYGSGFDGQRYLRRFFDLQYTLGEPSNKNFAATLTKNIAVPSDLNLVFGMSENRFILNDGRRSPNNIEIINYVLEKHSDAFNLPLRDQKQVAILLEASLHSLTGQNIHIFFLVFLAVFYQQHYTEFRAAAHDLSLDANSEIFRSLTRTNKGKIDISFHDSDGRTKHRNISILDIAQAYFSNMQSTSSSSQRYNDAFPANLFNEIERVREGGIFWAQYRKYFEIVQQAGGFTG
jgi:hypothetical protein